ncbi:MAG: efflux RND transporter permease subunit [Rhodobiaceae bacterium]|nr:efflux RND transporter permease subunit [Rhodobiaceae bacterium]MCC0042194.1 efflux RND transporter permease subunit [Rhodobiaceae bacterium]
MRSSAHGGVLGFFIHHRNAANLMMAMMLLFGAFALLRLNTQFFPTVDIPRITVSVTWSGASAEDVEANILQAIEPNLRFLDGLEELRSYAREGSASINLEFAQGSDMQKAQADVETALSQITTLPEDAEEPKVSRRVWYESVATVSVSGPFSEEAIRAFARDIRDSLLDAGIDKVDFTGLRDREYRVTVPEWQLRRLGLSVGDIGERIRLATRDMPSGTLDGAIEKQLRSLAEIKSPEEIGDVEVVSGAGGEKVFLRDIAAIATAFDEDQSIGYRKRARAIELDIQRALTSDTLESRRILLAHLDALKGTLPPSLDVSVYNIRADLVQERINLLVVNGAQGLLFVLAMLFLFLNARVAFWVAMGIPTAVMATLGLMLITGQSINMISLFALIMMLGIIVDDAIVVGEHTATRFSAGDPPALAAEVGSGRMFWPVVAATLTTQAAFLPLFFVRDTIGQIMSALPMVVIAALFASLIESFFVLPGHLRHSLSSMRAEPGRVRASLDRWFDAFRNGPFRFLARLSFRWRYVTVALALSSIVVAAGALAGGRVSFQFFPSPEAEQINAQVVMAAGTPQADVDAAMRQIEGALQATVSELAPPGEELVDAVFTEIGVAGTTRGMNAAQMSVHLTASEVRSVRTTAIIAAWRKKVPKIPGVEDLVITSPRGGPPGRDVEIELRDAPPDVLKAAALELRDVLASYPGVSSISDDLPYGKPEIVMQLTPRGTALGFTLQSVGQQVRDAFDGAIARRFADGDDEVTIRVVREQREEGIAALANLALKAPNGVFVPLTEIVSLRERQGFAVIQRLDAKTTVAVSGDLDSSFATPQELRDSLEASGAVRDIATRHGVSYKYAGREEERVKAFADLKYGTAIGLGLIYLVLAWVFASYTVPLAVMLVIPFGFVGAVLGHYVMGFSLTILSLMGLLGLSGILVNDSIILVSRARELRDHGATPEEAAVNASCDRLRAVLLTSLTTVGGLAPLLAEKSLQAQFLLPMAITLVFGLGVATLFVLFLVPAYLGVGGDIARAGSAISRWLLPRRHATPAE